MSIVYCQRLTITITTIKNNDNNINKDNKLVIIIITEIIVYLYTFAICPSLGGSRQHKRNNKTLGNSLRSSSNNEGHSRVWMALLEQHSPSSPTSTTYVASYMPSPLLSLPQDCLYKATPWQQQMPIRAVSQSFATHSYP